MKKLLLTICSIAFAGAASAADITVYYSPSCPHCHHALAFIGNELVYEYQTINAESVNVTTAENYPAFEAALKKCEFESGGVPVIVVGEKCFQGYADFMGTEIRDAVAVGLSDADKAAATANRQAMDSNAEKFKSENAARANVIVERTADAQKKTEKNPVIYFYGLLALLVVGLGFVLVRKKK